MKSFFVVTILSFDKNTFSDYFSCDDLFTYVAYHDQKRRTITKWNQSAPEWNEDLVFSFSPETKSIKIAIMDEDRWKPSEKVWERTIPIIKENIGKVIHIDSLSLIYDVCIMNSLVPFIQEKRDELNKMQIVLSQLNNLLDEKQSDIQDLELSNLDIYQSGLLD